MANLENFEKHELGLAPAETDLVPPILQSFSSLFRLRGKQVSAAHLMSALAGSAPSPAACVRAVKALGLDCKIVNRESLLDISNMVLPCVLLTKSQSSVVLVKYDEKEATVIFPEHGHEANVVPLEELQEEYSGYAVFSIVAPERDEKLEKITRIYTKHWFFDVVKQYIPMYKSVLLATAFINILALMGPLFMMNVYDRVIPNIALETLWVLGFGIMVGYIFEWLLRLLRTQFTDRVSRNMDVVLSSRIMEKILSLDITKNTYTSGGLMQAFRELDSIREFFSASTMLVLIDVPFLVFFLTIVFFIGGPLVSIPCVALVILLTYIITLQKKMYTQANVQQQGEREKNSLLVEMITGTEVIKTVSAEPRMMRNWEKISSYTADQNEKSKRLQAGTNNMSLLLTHFVSLALIVWGVYLISDQTLTMGGLIASNMLTARSMSFIVQFGGLLPRWQGTKSALKDLSNLMALPDEYASNTVDFGNLPHSIELMHVDFTFEGSPLPALSDVSLKIAPGEKVGVIGNMGSGKSTLSRVMVGLIEPSMGVIKFGGVDMRQLDKREVRSRMGYVPQEAMLFQGTVRDNICLGMPFVNDKLLLRAAWLTGVNDFIQNHPSGYSMPVIERGGNLSGGQRQAITLARALLMDPDVLILDEPTSNMDGSTEAALIKRLRPHIRNKTLIINMHRMSLMQLVDRVIVLKDGYIIADGPKGVILDKIKLPS